MPLYAPLEDANFVYSDPHGRFTAYVYGLEYIGGRYRPEVIGKDADACHDDESEDPDYRWDIMQVLFKDAHHPVVYPFQVLWVIPQWLDEAVDAAIIKQWWDEKRYVTEPPDYGE